MAPGQSNRGSSQQIDKQHIFEVICTIFVVLLAILVVGCITSFAIKEPFMFMALLFLIWL